MEGYYEIDNQLDCEKCPLTSCKRCDNSGKCLEC